MKIVDSAKDTFDASIARAERLESLYHGLVNTRKRGMRADWASNFENLMHWKQGTTKGRVDGNDAVIVIKENADLTDDDFTAASLSDLLRGSLVLTVSAMDAYFHRKVAAYIVACSRLKAGTPEKLENAKITIADACAMLDAKRPRAKLRTCVERQLGFQSLQRPKAIKEALSMIGINNFWPTVACRMSEDPADVKKWVEWIVTRRNQIAHEGDLSVAKKTQNQDRTLPPKDCRWSIDFISRLVDSAEDEINTQLSAM